MLILSFPFALCRLSLTGSSAGRTQARTTSNAQQHHLLVDNIIPLCAINISHNNAKCQSDWQKEQRFSAFPQRCPSSSPSSSSSQLPVTILTNAYSLSDSPIPAPLTTLHSSHFCCCCCLLSPPLLPHSSPAFLLFFFFYYIFHCHEAASSVWRHSHTNRATLEGQQREVAVTSFPPPASLE